MFQFAPKRQNQLPEEEGLRDQKRVKADPGRRADAFRVLQSVQRWQAVLMNSKLGNASSLLNKDKNRIPQRIYQLLDLHG